MSLKVSLIKRAFLIHILNEVLQSLFLVSFYFCFSSQFYLWYIHYNYSSIITIAVAYSFVWEIDRCILKDVPSSIPSVSPTSFIKGRPRGSLETTTSLKAVFSCHPVPKALKKASFAANRPAKLSKLLALASQYSISSGEKTNCLKCRSEERRVGKECRSRRWTAR